MSKTTRVNSSVNFPLPFIAPIEVVWPDATYTPTWSRYFWGLKPRNYMHLKCFGARVGFVNVSTPMSNVNNIKTKLCGMKRNQNGFVWWMKISWKKMLYRKLERDKGGNGWWWPYLCLRSWVFLCLYINEKRFTQGVVKLVSMLICDGYNSGLFACVMNFGNGGCLAGGCYEWDKNGTIISWVVSKVECLVFWMFFFCFSLWIWANLKLWGQYAFEVRCAWI